MGGELCKESTGDCCSQLNIKWCNKLNIHRRAINGRQRISTIKPHGEDYLLPKEWLNLSAHMCQSETGWRDHIFLFFYQIIPRLFCNGLSLFRLTIRTICQFGFLAMIFIFSENLSLLKWVDDICLFLFGFK